MRPKPPGARGIFLILAICGSFHGQQLYGQYYESREEGKPAGRFLAAGMMWRDFQPRPANLLPDSLTTRFQRVMPMLSFRQGLVDFYFGYSTFKERGENREAIVFGTQVATEVPLTGMRPSALMLPVMIVADYSKVEATGLRRDNFNIASIGLGIGLKFRVTTPSAEFWIQGVQVVHVAFEGIAAGTGSSLATLGEATLLLPRVPLGDGLVFSYRARLQTWSMKNDRFNYRSFYHGPSVGILF